LWHYNWLNLSEIFITMLTKDILNILACPACKGKLTARDNKSKLMCHSCGRAFPVREGIPVMLMDEAVSC